MRVLVTGFNLQETARQSGSIRFQTDLPYVLNVTLPARGPGTAGETFRLLRVLMPDGNPDVSGAKQSAAFVQALGQTPWTLRCPRDVWMISTGLSGAACALWNSLDAQLEPFEDLSLEFGAGSGEDEQ